MPKAFEAKGVRIVLTTSIISSSLLPAFASIPSKMIIPGRDTIERRYGDEGSVVSEAQLWQKCVGNERLMATECPWL